MTLKRIEALVYRYLTRADYFNMYKPTGTEDTGGGQTYIDFPVGDVPEQAWRELLNSVEGVKEDQRQRGPSWTFPVHSLGLEGEEELTVFQRRAQSFCVSSQRLGSKRSNRIRAWHPNYGFPEPHDPSDRNALPEGLAIYLTKTEGDEIWAGWFQGSFPCADSLCEERLGSILPTTLEEGTTGFIPSMDSQVWLNSLQKTKPLVAVTSESVAEIEQGALERSRTDEESEDLASQNQMLDQLFEEDLSSERVEAPRKEQQIARIGERNRRAVGLLKVLYGGKCQLTGSELTFEKDDGTLYSEAHHLIPIGEDGSDSPHNIIIVSPLIHRMLHYANVSKIDPSDIDEEDNTLNLEINGLPYVITWHPVHAEIVRRAIDRD